MPIFAEFPMLPIGSGDEHAKYLAKFNYRFYCASCIRNIESIDRLTQCPHCSSSNMVVLMEKEVKETVPWSKRLEKILKSVEGQRGFRVSKFKEELPTDVLRETRSAERSLPFNFSKTKEELPTKNC